MSLVLLGALGALFSICTSAASANDAAAPVALPPLDPGKFTVCTATINSTEEREAFKKHLPAKEFQFVELTTLGANSTSANTKDVQPDGDWFEQACQSGVQCDVLVVSGHFGGTFFGSSGYSLPLQKLEQHSCRSDCKGILSNPREVFLFGCNTLATKEKDHRTMEEYVRVLVADGFSRGDAERIAEGRYGAFGQENRDRMKRVFQGVPHLYGFDSVGPSGKNVKSKVETYLRSIPDYGAHLSKDAISQLSKGLIGLNQSWTNSMAGTSRAQCSGLNPDDPAYPDHERICALYDDRIVLADRLAIAEEMLKGERWMTYLPSVESFMMDIHVPGLRLPEREVFDRLKANAEIKDKVLSAIDKIRAPTLKLEWASFANKMAWLSDAEFAETSRASVRALLKPSLDREGLEILCSLPHDVMTRAKVEASDIPKGYYRTEYGLAAVNCLGDVRRSLEVRKEVLKTLASDKGLSNLAVGNALSALSSGAVDVNKDVELNVALEKEVLKVATKRRGAPEVQRVAPWAFTGTGIRLPETVQYLFGVMRKGDLETIIMVTQVLRIAKTLSPEVLNEIERLLLDDNELIRFAALRFFESREPLPPSVLRKAMAGLRAGDDRYLNLVLKQPKLDTADTGFLLELLSDHRFQIRMSIVRWFQAQEEVEESLLPKVVDVAVEDPEISRSMAELLMKPKVAKKVAESPELRKVLMDSKGAEGWRTGVLAASESTLPEVQLALAGSLDVGYVDQLEKAKEALIRAAGLGPEVQRALVKQAIIRPDGRAAQVLSARGVEDPEALRALFKAAQGYRGWARDNLVRVIRNSKTTEPAIVEFLKTEPSAP